MIFDLAKNLGNALGGVFATADEFNRSLNEVSANATSQNTQAFKNAVFNGLRPRPRYEGKQQSLFKYKMDDFFEDVYMKDKETMMNGVRLSDLTADVTPRVSMGTSYSTNTSSSSTTSTM